MSVRILRRLDDPSGTVVRAKAEAKKFGSTWEGDGERGTYRLRTPLGGIEGHYFVTDSVVTFVVEKKPMVVPLALIERVLDEFLGPGGRRV